MRRILLFGQQGNIKLFIVVRIGMVFSDKTVQAGTGLSMYDAL